MTLIVGIEDAGRVYMAADSGAWGSCGFVDSGAHFKLARVGPLLLGCAGDLRASNLVRHALDDIPAVEGDPERYLVREFVPRLRGVMEAHGADKTNDETSTKGWGGWCMVAVQGQIYALSAAYCVFRNTRGYAAVGADAARGVALGVLSVTKDRLPVAERLRLALHQAAEHTENVRAPFVEAVL